MKKNLFIAEAIGTFALVFAGCGAIVVNESFGGALGHLGVSTVFGLVVMAMIYSVGNVSGAHLNPAVTLGFVFAGRLDKRSIPGYIGSQLIGALAAAAALRLLFPESATLGSTLPGIDLARAFIVEVLLSFVLMFVILNVSTGHMEKGIMAGVAVGGTIALEALVGGPLTGASMNPARSLAPALLSGNLSSIWLYLTAPVVGTWLAHPTCRWIQGPNCCVLKPEGESSEADCNDKSCG
ncbi:major intrinsic protein [Chlorobaculum parvum NCIB 8327]|uniref:Major intrinsic protein n=1 Tax=Chlorobaculum parvum (strain DSM 263 / NCIMB 8327) TaxID=517417 RepID=B3QLH4_CHLP8|nr:aquaporin [Chlorobaculum parvum]ACF10864.1 major intrinsic protein [Chlorobaculum parvum NCIB 8327]